MNKLKSRRDYSIEKVLEEVQETQIRESFASRKPQCSENSDELNFRPGYVHLLKNKFSQLSDSKDSNGQKDSLMRKRSRCSEQKQIQSLEIISCTSDTSVTQPVRNESHKPNNLGAEKAEDTGTVASANQIQNVQFPKPMDETYKEKPSLEHMKSYHSSDTSELQELPIKNIVSATRFLFEKLGSNNSIISNTYSSSNDYTPSKVKQDVMQSAPKTKAKSMENLSNTKYSLPRSNSKTIQFSVIKPSSLKLETTVNSVGDLSKPSVRLLNTSSDKVQNQNLHSKVLTENSSNVKVTDISPAQDYLPGKKSANQHFEKDHSLSLPSNTATKPPVPQPFSKDKEISQDSRWKSFEDIPVPKRRTFVDDAKHVKISKNDLQTSRQGTKSWLFTTDTKKATESEKNVIAVQVKPSIHSSSPTSSKSIFGNNSNHISEERLAQQTFWDAYRSSDSRNFSILNEDIQDEVDMILKRKDEVSISGDHLMVDNSESKRTLNNTNFKTSNKVKKKIKFAADPNLIEEYEYQSEQSFYEELGIVPEYNLVNNSNNNNDNDEEDDDEDYVFLNPNAIGKQPVALSAYQTKASAEFSWSQPIFSEVKTTPPIASPESLQVTPNSETKSLQPDESFSFSDTTHADTDLLF